MPILITGGAGYIGSRTVKYFQEHNEEIIVVDNLQSGHKESIQVNSFYNIDIRDKEQLDKVFKEHKQSVPVTWVNELLKHFMCITNGEK